MIYHIDTSPFFEGRAPKVWKYVLWSIPRNREQEVTEFLVAHNIQVHSALDYGDFVEYSVSEIPDPILMLLKLML